MSNNKENNIKIHKVITNIYNQTKDGFNNLPIKNLTHLTTQDEIYNAVENNTVGYQVSVSGNIHETIGKVTKSATAATFAVDLVSGTNITTYNITCTKGVTTVATYGSLFRKGVLTPTADTDATTKKYVDDLTGHTSHASNPSFKGEFHDEASLPTTGNVLGDYAFVGTGDNVTTYDYVDSTGDGTGDKWEAGAAAPAGGAGAIDESRLLDKTNQPTAISITGEEKTDKVPYSIAIGINAGKINQGMNAIAMGLVAGQENQGEFSLAMGGGAGQKNQPEKSIVISANDNVVVTPSASKEIILNAGGNELKLAADGGLWINGKEVDITFK